MSWKSLLDDQPPEFNIGNITGYFVSRLTAYDCKPSNDYKNLNKHAYPLFKAGHIQNIEVSIDSQHICYKCICLPEMKKGLLYKIYLTLSKQTSDIESASCDCPAGLHCKNSSV